MPRLYKRDQFVLFFGDFVVLLGSLWLALTVRHFVAPSGLDFLAHLVPFSILFVAWLGVFVTVGLYDRHIALFEHQLPATITEAQLVNFAIAVAYFFLAPVGIQPKTILLLYFVISTLLIVVWRLGVFRFQTHQRACEPSLVIGYGPDMAALVDEIKSNELTQLSCAEYVDVANVSQSERARIVSVSLKTHAVTTLIVDPRVVGDIGPARTDPSIDVIDASDLYEALFSCVPLSLFTREQFLKIALSRQSRIYGWLKRMMDIVLSLILGALSLLVYPFVLCAIYFDDRGPLFVSQERVGRHTNLFSMYKFRSMSGNDQGQYGVDGKTKLHVTPVGNVLRKTRIDELPQLWSVLKGEQSLVGPRPELPALVDIYREQIPYYDLRHLVVPGLSGWAQLYHQAHPHHGSNVDETARKLSYDLYYIKHQSLILDLDIALKTMKALVLRLGA